MKEKFLGIILSIICLNLSFGQELQDGQKRWSSEKKLTIDDFKIKISDQNNEAVYSQFMISYSAQGFDFLKRNLNSKIGNLFLGNASWISGYGNGAKGFAKMFYIWSTFRRMNLYVKHFRRAV